MDEDSCTKGQTVWPCRGESCSAVLPSVPGLALLSATCHLAAPTPPTPPARLSCPTQVVSVNEVGGGIKKIRPTSLLRMLKGAGMQARAPAAGQLASWLGPLAVPTGAGNAASQTSVAPRIGLWRQSASPGPCCPACCI